MKKRIGNDIQFTWRIYRKDGETQVPESFTGKDVEVKLISPLQRPVTIEDVSIATGVVTFTFRGKHQVTLGNYVAVLLENKGEDGMVTLDVVNAVTLVPHSYMEEDGDEGDVIEAEAVELESSISAGAGGGIEQQQADWVQTDDTAVDYIKNKPNLNLFAKLDVSNEHEQNTSDTYKQLYGGEQELRRTSIGGGGLLLRVGRLQPVWFEYEDAKKLNDLPTATELAQELEGKANTADLAEVATSGSYNDLSNKPDLSGFITNSVDDLTNYYLKSETYTKTEVQQLIGAIQQFHYEVYPTLPQTGASNVLYLIGPTGTGTDKYEEYVYANNDWTKIGDTSIDLSGYVTTEALNTALADYVTSSALSTALANYYNKTEVDGLLATKADKSEMSVAPGTGTDVDKTTITLKQGTSATVLTAHQDISGKENVMPITTATGATLSAVVGNYYRLDNVGTLAITLPTITGATKLQAITFLLACGSSALVTFAPQGSETILYQEDFALEADTTYEVTALWNGSEWTLSRVIYE